LIHCGPTGSAPDRPARPPKLKSGEPLLTKVRRRPMSVCGTRLATLHKWSVRQTRERQSPRQHSPPPHRPAAGDGWHGRVNAQKARPGTIQSAARKRRGSRESLVWIGSVRRPVPRRKLIGAIESERTTRGPPPRKRGWNCPAGAKLRRAKSHERCRPAGHPTAPATPARRRKTGRAETGTPGPNASPWRMSQGIGDPTLRATADALDGVLTPNSPSPACPPEASGEKPQGRTGGV